MASDPPQPRLCQIAKVDNFDGFGFNLHAEKNKPGQFIGKIDGGSPAEVAGLKEGDRIVEVNGVNVNQENHKQVVARIKSIENETKLLVVDKACEDYHKQQGIVVRSNLPYVVLCSNKASVPEVLQTTNDNEELIDTRLQNVTIEDVRDDDSDTTPSPTSLINGEEDNKLVRDYSFNSNKSSKKMSTKSSDRSSSSSSPSPSDDKFLALDLPITAAEMKRRISSKKKKDPRKDNRMDFTRKHQIVQSL